MGESYIHKTFGLTNAPSIFQSLMNDVFKHYLRKSTLVFFDDILVYSKSVTKHLMHLKFVLQTMHAHTLFAKRSKCTFEVSQVEYLRHIISDKKVATNLAKIKSMKDCMYPRMINNRQDAFMQLKEAMIPALLLGFPNFEREFTMETDACGTVEGYLMDRHFKIKTDHFSLKFLLDQRHTTSFQAKWLPKLLGYNYEVAYKKGNENVVADALSWKEMQGQLFALIATNVTTDLLKKVQESWVADEKLVELIKTLTYPKCDISIDFVEGLLKCHGKTIIFVVEDRLSNVDPLNRSENSISLFKV
ncbi:putative mitochondrial protein [Tanacetum coccineum]